ncbi:DUF3011 domain-containing protein [Pseudoxanthomonas sp. 10H]|uniref:DUF3011 domain-containing protein n=1 Tax=Pseudoxanthomonas sp. 10H TaxID=3242729 RepID=UPI003557C677
MVRIFASSLVLLGVGLAASPARAALPQFNATCPGGIEVHADAGGPVYVDGRQAQLQRFNDDAYEARDATRGVTLSIGRTADGVQLSYTGPGTANGVCQVAGAADAAGVGPAPSPASTSHPSAASTATEVTCESQGQQKAECAMDTRGEVRMVRQLSHGACVEGQSWGLARNSVWVSDGCRATFRNASARGGDAPAPVAAAEGDLLGACNVRAGAAGRLVTRVPVGSDAAELIVDYPDGRYVCMVRNDGFVTSLTRIRAR